MDNNTAKKLFLEGGIFIFLNVPEGTEFGIDMKSYNTGEKFRGVKMIPSGIHYIFYSAVGKFGDTAPRIGFFYNFRKSEVLVKKWDQIAEEMSDAKVIETEVVRLKDNILALDNFLGPYPGDIYDRWKSLTSHITDELVERLSPISGKIRSALELQSCVDADRPRDQTSPSGSSSKQIKRSKVSHEDNLLPNLKPVEGTAIRFTEIPTKNYPEGATASEITKHSMDSSYTLEMLLKSYKYPIDIIGELEYAYICFLVGHSLEAFEHWKSLISLLCTCDSGIKKYRLLFDQFISVLELQVKEIPEEFLADIVTNNNFVYIKLRTLFLSVQESDMDGQFKAKVDRFKKDLHTTYGWDFNHLESEDEDDAPVVVELDE